MLGLASQIPAPAQNGKLHVGFVHINTQCWTFFRFHLMASAKALEIQVTDRPISTLHEQVSEIHKLLDGPIDVLMFRPVATDAPGLLDVLRRAQTLGVKLIAIDGSVGGGFDLTTVGVDNRQGQADLTDYICRRLGGKGKIAHLQGDQKMDAGRLRTQGLHHVVAQYPGIDLVFEVGVDWGSPIPLRTQGEALAREALAANPQLKAIITTSDESAYGVYDVLLELGLQEQVLVTGFDALPDALIAIDEGRIEASVHQPLELMAERALQDALRLTSRDPGPATHTQLAADIISKATLVDAALRALRLFPDVIGDLTQRRLQQQANATFLETLIDNLPHALFVKDAERLAYVRHNRAADAWLNAAPGSQLGKTAFDIFPAEVAEHFNASDREILAGGIAVDIQEEESYLPDVGKRYVHTQKIPIFDAHGKPAFLLGISQDITERKQAEAILAQHARDLEVANEALKENQEKLVAAGKMAALGSLVAGVAHELNTPIGNGMIVVTTLKDHTRNLASHYPNSLTRSMLEDYLQGAIQGGELLERNLNRAAELINSFKQIAIDQTSSQARRFSLSTLVAEVTLALRPSLRRTPITIEQEVPDGIMMDSYPGPLEQVLINLINNAVTHGFAGRDKGHIRISAGPSAADQVELVVADDGVGIAENDLPKIFIPFFTTNSDAGGSGLGLSISHDIVTGLLGGRIDVDSTVGHGSRFRLTLPLRVTRKPVST